MGKLSDRSTKVVSLKVCGWVLWGVGVEQNTRFDLLTLGIIDLPIDATADTTVLNVDKQG
jgi:hypothetical protein